MENRTDEKLIADYLTGESEALEILVKRYLKPVYNMAYRYAGNGEEAEDITQEVFVKAWRNLKKSAPHIFCRGNIFRISAKKDAENTRDARARIAQPSMGEARRPGILCKKCAGFDPAKGNFKPWLFSIAKNTCFDFLKKSRTASGAKKTISFSEFSARIAAASGGENGENDILEEMFADPSPLPDEILERKWTKNTLAAIVSGLSPKYREVLSLRYNDNFTFREAAEALGEKIDTVKSRYRRALIMLKKIIVEEQPHQIRQ